MRILSQTELDWVVLVSQRVMLTSIYCPHYECDNMFNEWGMAEWFLLIINLLVISLVIFLVRRKFMRLMEKVEKRHNQTAEKRRIQARELLEK